MFEAAANDEKSVLIVHKRSLAIIILLLTSTILLSSVMEGKFLLFTINVEKMHSSVPFQDSQGGRISFFVTIYKPEHTLDNSLPVVLLVHGFSSNALMMEPLALYLARRGMLVVTYDLAGHGASNGVFEIEKAQELLVHQARHAQMILDAVITRFSSLVNRSQIAVVGHSLGANIALLLGINDSTRVKSVVTMGVLELPISTENAVNETVPRNFLVISASFDQLVDENSIKRYLRPLFPTDANENVDCGEWGDVSRGSGRKYCTVVGDHVLMPLSPAVHELVYDWLVRSFSIPSRSSVGALQGLLLIGAYYGLRFVQFSAIVLLLMYISLLVAFLSLKQWFSLNNEKSLMSIHSHGKEIQIGNMSLFRDKWLFFIFLLELGSFVLGLGVTYPVMMFLAGMDVKSVSMAFISVFWSFFSVAFLLLGLLHRSRVASLKKPFIDLKMIKQFTDRERNAITGHLAFFLVFLLLLVIGLNMASFWLDVTVLVIRMRFRSFERIFSVVVVLFFMLIHVIVLDLYIEKTVGVKRRAFRFELAGTGTVVIVPVVVEILTIMAPSFIIPSLYKAGMLFFAATIALMALVSGIIAVISMVFVQKVVVPAMGPLPRNFTRNASFIVFSLLFAVFSSSLYPVLG